MENPQPKVSIIVPVYKAESYVEKCVHSLYSQTLDELEYIFVDDYSPDRSIDVIFKVLEEYPGRKSQVKVIRHETNLGVGQSRQDGMDAATGEYIIHCDPDDWVETCMYEIMYSKAKTTNADIVICDYILETKNASRLISQKPTGLLPNEVLSNLAKGKIYGSFWNKLVKVTTISENNIHLLPGLNVCEDLFFFLQLLKKDITIEYLPSGLYHYDYFINPNSIQRTSLPNHINLDEQIIKFSQEILAEKKYRLEQYAIITGSLFHLFQIQNCTNQEFRQKYFSYYNMVTADDSLLGIYKFFLKLSLWGFLSQSQRCFCALKKIKRLFS